MNGSRLLNFGCHPRMLSLPNESDNVYLPWNSRKNCHFKPWWMSAASSPLSRLSSFVVRWWIPLLRHGRHGESRFQLQAPQNSAESRKTEGSVRDRLQPYQRWSRLLEYSEYISASRCGKLFSVYPWCRSRWAFASYSRDIFMKIFWLQTAYVEG